MVSKGPRHVKDRPLKLSVLDTITHPTTIEDTGAVRLRVCKNSGEVGRTGGRATLPVCPQPAVPETPACAPVAGSPTLLHRCGRELFLNRRAAVLAPHVLSVPQHLSGTRGSMPLSVPGPLIPCVLPGPTFLRYPSTTLQPHHCRTKLGSQGRL